MAKDIFCPHENPFYITIPHDRSACSFEANLILHSPLETALGCFSTVSVHRFIMSRFNFYVGT